MTKALHLYVERVPSKIIITGDPKRVSLFSNFLENSSILTSNREFELLTGIYGGEETDICSTGIGAPSTAICITELVEAGARTIIRLGSTGVLQKGIKLGDVIIAT